MALPIAKPKPAVKKSHRSTFPQWQRDIDNYDRSVRRRNRLYWDHCLPLGQSSIELISNDRRVPLSDLNRLPATKEPRD